MTRRGTWEQAGIAAVVAASCVALTACGGAGAVIEANGIHVLVGEESSEGMSAALTGSLGVVNGCLAVDELVVLWPHGTEVVEDGPLTIDVPRRGEYALGDEIENLGGGGGPSTAVDGIAIPDECSGEIWLAH